MRKLFKILVLPLLLVIISACSEEEMGDYDEYHTLEGYCITDIEGAKYKNAPNAYRYTITIRNRWNYNGDVVGGSEWMLKTNTEYSVGDCLGLSVIGNISEEKSVQ